MLILMKNFWKFQVLRRPVFHHQNCGRGCHRIPYLRNGTQWREHVGGLRIIEIFSSNPIPRACQSPSKEVHQNWFHVKSQTCVLFQPPHQGSESSALSCFPRRLNVSQVQPIQPPTIVVHGPQASVANLFRNFCRKARKFQLFSLFSFLKL